MINKILIILVFIFYSFSSYCVKADISTTASVVMAGGIIKAQNIENTKKYNRKDCPICKGKGWYISGDGISKVNCGYCEPEKQQPIEESVIVHPPIIINQNCSDGSCSGINKSKRKR